MAEETGPVGAVSAALADTYSCRRGGDQAHGDLGSIGGGWCLHIAVIPWPSDTSRYPLSGRGGATRSHRDIEPGPRDGHSADFQQHVFARIHATKLTRLNRASTLASQSAPRAPDRPEWAGEAAGEPRAMSKTVVAALSRGRRG